MSRIPKLSVPAIPRAKTTSEKRGFIKAVIDPRLNRIPGCAILSVEKGAMLDTAQMAMIAGLLIRVDEVSAWRVCKTSDPRKPVLWPKTPSAE